MHGVSEDCSRNPYLDGALEIPEECLFVMNRGGINPIAVANIKVAHSSATPINVRSTVEIILSRGMLRALTPLP